MLREKSRTNHYIAAVIGIAVLVFLDQLTKCLAIDRLKGQYQGSIPAGISGEQRRGLWAVSESEDLFLPKRHRHMRGRLMVLSQGAYGEAFSAASAVRRIYRGGGLWKLY